MTEEKRARIIEKVAQKRTEDAEIEALMSYFKEGQEEFLGAMSDEELLNHLKEYELEYLAE